MMNIKDEGLYDNDKGHTIITSKTIETFPHDCVGAIYAEIQGKSQMIGTGFLIGSDLVATVAHNIYYRDKNMDMKNIIFYLGVSGDITEEKTYKVVDYRYNRQQFRGGFEEEVNRNDYALMKIERKIEKKAYLELGVNYIEQDEYIGIVGYRGTGCSAQAATQSSVWLKNRHNMGDRNFLYHRLSTLRGNSGSPIIAVRDKRAVVIAIHKGQYSKANSNIARLLTDEVLCDFLRWEIEMRPLVSEIRINVMKNDAIEMDFNQTYDWLQYAKQTVKATIKYADHPHPKEWGNTFKIPFNRQNNEKQRKFMQKQIEQLWISDIVQKLEKIPQTEKNQIDSLTLKCVFIPLQSVQFCKFSCIYSAMKRIILLIQMYLFRYEEYNSVNLGVFIPL